MATIEARMQPHQERVVEEEKALREKFDKLNAFLIGDTFKTVSDQDGDLLRRQHRHMGAYLDVLVERIARFG